MDRSERRRRMAPAVRSRLSDRVIVDNSRPAGGHTRAQLPRIRLRFAAEGADLAIFFVRRPSSRQPAPRTEARPDRSPAARRTRRRACADRDRFPEAGTRSPARRDRPRRPCNGSGGSAASTGTATVAGLGRQSLRLRRKHQIDRLFDLALDRLQRHHAGLLDRGLHRAHHPQPFAAMARQIEAGEQPRQARHACELGQCRARRRVGRELDPPAGFRDVIDRDRHAPGPLLRSACFDGFAALMDFRIVASGPPGPATGSPPGREIQARRAPMSVAFWRASANAASRI